MPYNAPLLRRFLAKLFIDVLPAAMASAIGGFALTHYQVLTQAFAPGPSLEQHAMASTEVVRIVRDEHDQIADYLNAQMEAEKSRLAAEQRTSVRPVIDSHPAGAAPRRVMVAIKPVVAHNPSATVSAAPTASPRVPGVVAPAQANDGAEPPHDSDSLLAKTMRIKDTVIAATQRAGSVIGAVPSWIAAVGDHFAGPSASAPSPARLVSASW